MLNSERILEEINKYEIHEEWATILTCDYFGDEVTLIIGRENPCKLNFVSCYIVQFDHYWNDHIKDKPVRDLTLLQLPFSLQEIQVEVIKHFGKDVYKFYLHVPPLKAEIICKDLRINDVSVNDMPE